MMQVVLCSPFVACEILSMEMKACKLLAAYQFSEPGEAFEGRDLGTEKGKAVETFYAFG